MNDLEIIEQIIECPNVDAPFHTRGGCTFCSSVGPAVDALSRVTTLLQETVPVVDELIAWINTDNIGCLEVQERGEAILLRLRNLVDNLHPMESPDG